MFEEENIGTSFLLLAVVAFASYNLGSCHGDDELKELKAEVNLAKTSLSNTLSTFIRVEKETKEAVTLAKALLKENKRETRILDVKMMQEAEKLVEKFSMSSPQAQKFFWDMHAAARAAEVSKVELLTRRVNTTTNQYNSFISNYCPPDSLGCKYGFESALREKDGTLYWQYIDLKRERDAVLARYERAFDQLDKLIDLSSKPENTPVDPDNPYGLSEE